MKITKGAMMRSAKENFGLVYTRVDGLAWGWEIHLFDAGGVGRVYTDGGSYPSKRSAKRGCKKAIKVLGTPVDKIKYQEHTRRLSGLDIYPVFTVWNKYHDAGLRISRQSGDSFVGAETFITPVSPVPATQYGLWWRIKTAIKLIFTGSFGWDFSVGLSDKQVKVVITKLTQILQFKFKLRK